MTKVFIDPAPPLDVILDSMVSTAEGLTANTQMLYSSWGWWPDRKRITEARRVVADVQRALADADSELVDLAASLPPEAGQ